MPEIPATQEAEAGELPEPGGGGCGEPRSCHCTPAWVTRAKLRLKKIKIKIKSSKQGSCMLEVESSEIFFSFFMMAVIAKYLCSDDNYK